MVNNFPTVTYRKPKSLKDRLVHSYQNPISKSTWLAASTGFHKCNACKACKHVSSRKTFKLHNGKDKIINKFITCTTEYIVYQLECPCGLRYTGSTKQALKKWILEHQRAITNMDFSYPMARHFYNAHGSNRNLLNFCGIDRVLKHIRGGDREKELHTLESRYIIDLNTRVPYGLNREEELSTHIGV